MTEKQNTDNATSQAAQPIPQGGQQQIIINQQAEKKSNGVGTAGFVLSLIAIFFFWAPVFNWILWTLGLILSFVGVFRTPRGLSIAGLVISLIGIILIIAVAGALVAGFAAL